jgi:hypothetical protein
MQSQRISYKLFLLGISSFPNEVLAIGLLHSASEPGVHRHPFASVSAPPSHHQPEDLHQHLETEHGTPS